MTDQLSRKNKATIRSGGVPGVSFDQHEAKSKAAQRKADIWMIAGACLMGTYLLGLIGLPLFLYGLYIQRQASLRGLTVRPVMVTLIGYLVIIDGFLNSVGWALDFLANHSLLNRVFFTAWGNYADNGAYYWRYNELFIGGSSAPGEKGWEAAGIFVVFPMRVAAAIAFLQMKRWGHQWLTVTCWFGVVLWVGYITNMTVYADLRFEGTILPVIGWWAYDIMFITPFLAIPYLHTVNREIFSD